MYNPSNIYAMSVPPPFQQQTTTGKPATHLPVLYGYATTDTMGTVEANFYFNGFANFMQPNSNPIFGIGDIINCSCGDGPIVLTVSSITNGIETQIQAIDAGSVNTAAIQALAVTAPKIALGAVSTAQINASAGILGSQLSATAGLVGTQLAAGAAILGTQLSASAAILGSQLSATAGIVGTQLANNTISSTQIAANITQYAKVPMTLANFTGMYAAPFQLVAAPAAGLMIMLESMILEWVYGSAALTAGGAITAQLGNTVHAGGTIMSGSIAAADLTGLAASSAEKVGSVLAITANTSLTALGLFLSNATAAFATGTGGSANIHIWYRVITL